MPTGSAKGSERPNGTSFSSSPSQIGMGTETPKPFQLNETPTLVHWSALITRGSRGSCASTWTSVEPARGQTGSSEIAMRS